ncbi:hypothetical protein F4678DRAFT_316263 [Xylaria arbuscula]|nr:hypothetical protein F4678DRAFT_316263 [Xylaria arbuscula]
MVSSTASSGPGLVTARLSGHLQQDQSSSGLFSSLISLSSADFPIPATSIPPVILHLASRVQLLSLSNPMTSPGPQGSDLPPGYTEERSSEWADLSNLPLPESEPYCPSTSPTLEKIFNPFLHVHPVDDPEEALSPGPRHTQHQPQDPSSSGPSSAPVLTPQLEPGRRPPPAMGDRKVPDLNSCGQFNGKESAGRWIARLHWEFRRMGYPESEIPPSDAIVSINMLCTDDAATFLDSDPNLLDVIERANQAKATVNDLIALEQALKDKYPVKPVDNTAMEADDLTRMSQKTDEPLAQYYSRIRNALRRAGGKDIPKEPGDKAKSLTLAEITLLRTVVSRFVDGLADSKLRREALSNRARTTKSLWQCYKAVQESQRVLEDKEKNDEEEK